MHSAGLRRGLLGVGLAASNVALLIACPMGWTALAFVVLPKNTQLMSENAQRYWLCVLITLTIGALVVQVGGRVILHLRRLMAQIREMDMGVTPAVNEAAPDNVRAFVLGRRVGRGDRAPTLLP